MDKNKLMKIGAAILGLVFIILSPVCLYYLWIITPKFGFYGRFFYIYFFPLFILINGIFFLFKHRFIPYVVFINLLICLSFIAQEKITTLYYSILYWNDKGHSLTGILKNSIFHVLSIYQHLLFIPTVFLFLLLFCYNPSAVKKLKTGTTIK
jgi:hypothetical protein